MCSIVNNPLRRSRVPAGGLGGVVDSAYQKHFSKIKRIAVASAASLIFLMTSCTSAPLPPPPAPSLPDLTQGIAEGMTAPIYFKSGAGISDSEVVVGVKNSSDEPVYGVSVELGVDGERAYELLIPQIGAGQTEPASVTLEKLRDKFPEFGPGKYNFYMNIDPHGSIDESNKLNNTYASDIEIPVSVFQLPDLTYGTPEGMPAPIYFKWGTEINDSEVVFGVKNSGSESAYDIPVKLTVSNNDYSLIIPEVSAGSTEPAAISLERLVEGGLHPGKHNFKISIDPENLTREIRETNNSYSASVVIARSAVPRREPQSEIEAKIQESFDNYTWYTQQNIGELIEIAKEVLKDVPINWSSIDVTVLPFNQFYTMYSEVFIYPPEELTKLIENDYLRGYGFTIGILSTTQQVFLREGILLQVLPALIRELGEVYYGQTNRSGWLNGVPVNAHQLAESLFECYGLSVLQERFGLDALTNASCLANKWRPISHTLDWDTAAAINSRRLWTVVNNEGYLEGNIPSDVLFKLYNRLMSMPSPTQYVTSLDEQAKDLDKEQIHQFIEWRLFVDKELTPIPEDLKEKLDPNNQLGADLTLDRLLISQNLSTFPY